jgi:catechol 2,3-dioxygenase-like lactoylglutathione lyase family enzyme
MNRSGTQERARESGDSTRWWGLPAGFWSMLVAVLLFLMFRGPSAWSAVQTAAARVETASFHHIHLNVANPDSTLAFYQRFFGAYPVQYRNRSPALFTERSFILMDRVPEQPPSNVGSALYHVGWSGVVGPTEFEWRVQDGIEVETPATPLGTNYYMYFWGPDRELLEVYTGNRNHRFEHLHFVVPDQRATSEWFQRHLGIPPLSPGGLSLGVDNINLIITQIAGPGAPNRPVWYPEAQYWEDLDVRPTNGTAIDHIAFLVSRTGSRVQPDDPRGRGDRPADPGRSEPRAPQLLRPRTGPSSSGDRRGAANSRGAMAWGGVDAGLRCGGPARRNLRISRSVIV